MGGVFGKGTHKPAGSAALKTVTPWDAPGIKRLLDESMVRAVEDGIGGPLVLRESHGYGNLKLTLMTLACIAAAVSQFYPLPFPDNRIILGVCAGFYFFISGILQFLATFIDGDVVYKGKVKGKSTGSAKGKEEEDAVVLLRSTLAKHDEWYTVIAECPPGKEVSRLRKSIGAWLTKGGELAESVLVQDVNKSIVPKLADAAGVKVAAGAGSSSNSSGAAAAAAVVSSVRTPSRPPSRRGSDEDEKGVTAAVAAAPSPAAQGNGEGKKKKNKVPQA